jgi:hypothetical protein
MMHTHKDHRPFLLTLYLVWLLRGNALRGGGPTLRTDTLKGYLRAAASWATSAGLPDPRYLPTRTSFFGRQVFAPPLDKLLTFRRNWETLPNRREPLTPTMVAEAHMRAKNSHPDSLAAAMADWLALGLSTGFRLSEWAQRSHSTVKRIASPTSLPVAIIRKDVTFLDRFHHIITDTDLIRGTATPMFARLQWRVQKNGNNGETQTYARADTDNCPVAALIRIVQRAARIRLGKDLPIALYVVPPRSTYRFISDSDISSALQSLAQYCYGSLDTASVQRFSSHSIRVGACVILHASGQTGTFIKHRLRWRSDTFLLYLRDVPALAVAHAAAISNSHSLLIAPTAHQHSYGTF